MRLEVLQVAAICYSGNEFLASGDESLLVEVQLRKCFKGIDSLEFRKASIHQFAAPGAAFIEGTKTWYRRLRAEGVEELRLLLPPTFSSPNPEVWGLVADSDAGCDVWVPRFSRSVGSQRSHLEFSAQKYTPWNLARGIASSDAYTGLFESWNAIAQALRVDDDLLARVVADERAKLETESMDAGGFEDIYPATYSLARALLATAAIRAVTALTSLDATTLANPRYTTLLEAVWQSAMRCFEATRFVETAQAA
jgi:hypothetical protein